jgi:class 3 adenylate cyclase
MPAVTAAPSAHNVILTGIARSGTTLACVLLNRLARVVALNEPLSPAGLLGQPSRQAVADRVEEFFAAQRASLRQRGEAASRVRDGQIPDSPYLDEPAPDGRRRSAVKPGLVRVDKALGDEFLLVIKHPSCFTALLDVLVGRFHCVAIVRNPLAVLLSWHTTSGNWNQGRQPVAEAFDPMLRHRLDDEPCVLNRQLKMLQWSFGQYARYLPPDAVLRYEDIVASGGAALAVIDPAAADLAQPLQNRNDNPIYGTADVGLFVGRLLAVDGPWRHWYRPDAVAGLARALTG